MNVVYLLTYSYGDQNEHERILGIYKTYEGAVKGCEDYITWLSQEHKFERPEELSWKEIKNQEGNTIRYDSYYSSPLEEANFTISIETLGD